MAPGPVAYQYATYLYSPTPLPDVSEDFAAHALSCCLTVGEQARRRGDDRHAEATQNTGQVGGFRIDAQAGLGHPAQPSDAAFTARAVLELHHQRLAHASILGVVV